MVWCAAWAAAAVAADRVAIAFVGDVGSGDSGQARVRDRILESGASVVFFVGDNVYPRGAAEDFERKFTGVYRVLSERGIEVHAALGNHDVARCPAAARDPLPDDAGAYRDAARGCDVELQLSDPGFGYPGARRYYSVPVGDPPLAEVFVLDSNTLGRDDTKLRPGRQDAAQLRWLERALAASRAPWKLVALHHPPHTPRARGFLFGIGGHGRDAILTAQLEPILLRGGVDAVFAGHNHFYARLEPQSGIRYFVTGGGGRDGYSFRDAPGYVATGGRFRHFVLVTLDPASLAFQAIDDDGQVRDSGWFAHDGGCGRLPTGDCP